MDAVTLEGDVVKVHGWACTPDATSQIEVHVYLGAAQDGAMCSGQPCKFAVAGAMANEGVVEAALSEDCGYTQCCGGALPHRYNVLIPIAHSNYQAGMKVFVHGLGGNNVLLKGSGVYALPPLPPRSVGVVLLCNYTGCAAAGSSRCHRCGAKGGGILAPKNWPRQPP